MAKHFGTNSLAGLSRTSTAVTEVTTAGRFDSSYTSLAISLPSSATEYVATPLLASAATGTSWVRFDAYLSGSSNSANSPGLFLQSSGSTGVFRLIQTGSGASVNHTFQGQYWNGSAWTNTGAAFVLVGGALHTFAIKVIHNTSFEVYAGSILRTSGSGWSGGPTSSNNIAFNNGGGTGNLFVSQIMWADYDLRDSKLMLTAINGNSAANTGGTGTFTDINETPINEATAEVVSVSGNKMGQTKAALTLPGGYDIKGMVVAGRGRVSGTITNGKFGIRSGGTNYSSASLNFAAAYEPRVYISETDPATGTDFTQSGYNSAETYFEAV